ncbi:MAG: OmpA family protein [Chitinophagales bacterium]|nr:OmpA family protein [Chitinophagales bacterium]
MRARAFAILSLFVFATLPFAGVCQKKAKNDSISEKEALPLKIKIKYADALCKAGNYYDAIEVFHEILNEKPENSYAMYHLGECYFKARDYVNAEKWYGKVINAGADGAFPLVFYRYAMMEKMNGKYEQAKYSFAKFALRADAAYIDRARREIEACDFSKAALDAPRLFRVQHLDSVINTPYSEYSPFVLDQKLYYASLNHDTSMSAEKYLSHLYSAEKKSAEWGQGSLLLVPFNSADFHSGNCAFSTDSKRMYFTRCTDNGEANIHCSIMLSTFESGFWTEPIPLSEEVNTEEFTNTHPAVMQGDSVTDILYFTSNRPSGRGGMDLWYSEVKFDGVATAPVNLGPVINTMDDEVTPFYYKNKMYFSSTGHVGMGGLDIFYSSGLKSGWTKPQNMGYPLNSSADDFHFTRGETPKKYYLVSNRAGSISLKSATCCDDIFLAEDLSAPKFSVRGVVVEKTDTALAALTGARIEVFEVVGNYRSTVNDLLLPGDFKFSIELGAEKNYELKVQKKGYFPEIVSVSTKGLLEADTFMRDVTLTRIEKNKAYKLDKIYYEFNKTEITAESKATLKQLYDLMIENPKLVLEISAHTDDVGKEDYNLNLSQQRAQNCVNYLIKEDIEAKRLIAKGYGESQPVAANKNPDGSYNETGMQENRRTEFKVIGELSRVGDKIIYD